MSKGSKWYTAGYWYKFSAHAVLCHGPVDAVTRIIAGERPAWTGNVTANTTLDIEQTDLFGGQDAEGGWRGKIDVLMGEDDQAVNACIAANRPATAAAYQGVTSLVFRGKSEDVVSSVWTWLGGGTSPFKVFSTYTPPDSLTDGFWWTANAQSPKPFWTEVKHILKGRSWYTAKATIGAYDMNPAHMIYAVLTNAQYALGRPASDIDDTAFRAAADTLYAEGFGLSLAWYDNTSGEDFIHLILNHINGVLYTEPATGKWVLKLARGGYDVGSLPVINASNATLESFDRAGWGEIVNTLTVSYMNRSTAKEASLTVHNPAAISAQGGQIIASSKSYMGIHDDVLAARVAQRDLLSTSTPLATCTLIGNRTLTTLRPGDVFKLTWAPLGIENLVMRVGAIDYGTLTDGKVRLTAGEDVFGMPVTSYVASQPSQWTDPMTAPVAPAHAKAVELPYWEVSRTMTASAIADLDPDFGVGAVYITPTGLVDEVPIYAAGTADGVYMPVANGGLVTTATLGAAIGVGELTTGVVINDLKNPEPMADSEYGYLGDECVLVTAYDAGTNTYTLRRGLLDTVPQVHGAGTRFYFGVDGMNFDETERLLSETVYYKAAPKNTYGELALGSITPVSVTMANRYQRPYAPGKLRINGAAYPTVITGDLVVTWAHRDRTLQTAYVVTQDEANIGPEAGVTYTVKVYGNTGTLIHTESGLTGTSWTYTQAAETADAGSYQSRLRVTVEAIRDGLTSWQKHDHTFDRAGLGLSLGKYLGGV